MPGFEHVIDYSYPTNFDSLAMVEGWARDIWKQLSEAQHGFAEDLELTMSQKAYFKTITGITNDVVADQQEDTLTLAGDSLITITGTAATDTITWAWAHLGIESLADPGADRIAFWDDGETAFKWLAPDGTTIEISGTTLQVLAGGLDHGGLSGLADDDHPQYILHSLADAANDFLVASGADTLVKKTLAETGAILEGDIEHNNLQGFVANEHINWTNTANALVTTDDVTGQFLSSNATTPRFYMKESGTIRAEFRYGAAANAWIVLTGNAAAAMTSRIMVRGEQDFTSVGIGMTPPVATVLAIKGATENIEFIDAGSAGATEQDWIQVEIGGVVGYIRVYASV